MKVLKPTTPGSRGTKLLSFKGVTAKKPHKKLTSGAKRASGRGTAGRITMRHKGGGHKRRYRKVDFLYNKHGIPGRIETIEYDPHRTGFIALVCYKDGEKRYLLVPSNIEVGSTIVTAEKTPLRTGNRMMLKHMPVGTSVYNIELKPNGGAKLARSAGNFAEVVAQDAGNTNLKLSSGEVRKVSDKCFASIGSVSNEENKLRVLGKAGRSRHMGRRPTVRGSAMNPVDHPYGGGEGRAGRGRRRAVSKWGKGVGKGQKTRRPKKYSNVFIVSSRHKKRKR